MSRVLQEGGNGVEKAKARRPSPDASPQSTRVPAGHASSLAHRGRTRPDAPLGSFDWGIVYMPTGWHQQGERTRIFYHGTNYLHFHAWIREKLSGLYGGMSGKEAEGLLTGDAFVERDYLAPPSTRGTFWSLMPSGWSWRKGVHGVPQEARTKFWRTLRPTPARLPRLSSPGALISSREHRAIGNAHGLRRC